MVSATGSLLAIMFVAGSLLCVFGVVSYRRRDDPGSTLFGVFVGLWGAMPIIDAVAGAVLGIAGVSGILWVVAVVPWFLFTLQYTGREFGYRSWLFLLAPALGVLPWLWSASMGRVVPAFEVVGILVFVYYAAVAVIGSLLVLQAANRYGHLSLAQGVWLALAGAIPAVTMNTFGVLTEQFDDALLFGVYTAGLVGSCVVVALALFWEDVFDSTPAAGTVGERAIIRETEDVIVITDDGGEVILHNETADPKVLAFEGDVVGDPIEVPLGLSIDDLAAKETVELQTDEGIRRFDPRVTALTDQHDRRIGSMISLRDITDREIRRQRLTVLNRIVRHNFRNQASVIKANTEVVADELNDEQLLDRLDTAAESVDSLTALSHKAKTIETILGDESETTTVDLRGVLDDIAAESSERWPEATVAVRECPDVRIEANRRAVEFALSNLVENAVEHADNDAPAVELAGSVERDAQRVTITVADDGPGIPDREVEVLEAGEETPLKHGSGIGLWVTNWTVRELGGELTFPERGPDGSTVAVQLPTRPRTDSQSA
ncbi:ATP-binding protein [Halovenus sp. HT40]|uniref:ATP-binding protein n=1 Tax=Halovenus sp. HT40 TaxID=3126691 RepID=UPI00300F71CB